MFSMTQARWRERIFAALEQFYNYFSMFCMAWQSIELMYKHLHLLALRGHETGTNTNPVIQLFTYIAVLPSSLLILL